MFYNRFLPAFFALAQRAFAASEMRFLAAALSLRLGLSEFDLRAERCLPFWVFVPASAARAALMESR